MSEKCECGKCEVCLKEGVKSMVTDIASKDVAKQELPPVSQSPFDKIISVLGTDKLDLEQIEKIMAIQEKYEEREAKKAFDLAMSEFKKIPIKITKDAYNPKFKSNYTTIGNLVNTVIPVMSKFGFSHDWDYEQSDKGEIKVTCTITHSQGHSKSVFMTGPADTAGSKNPIQEIKSTTTYLRSCTFEAVLGLASSSDSNIDDDGNGSNSGDPDTISPEMVTEIGMLETVEDLNKYWSDNKTKVSNFRAFSDAINYRKAEILKAGN